MNVFFTVVLMSPAWPGSSSALTRLGVRWLRPDGPLAGIVGVGVKLRSVMGWGLDPDSFLTTIRE